MPHMRKSEDWGPSVKTAKGAARLGLYAGGLKLRSLAGMERKGRANLLTEARFWKLVIQRQMSEAVYSLLAELLCSKFDNGAHIAW